MDDGSDKPFHVEAPDGRKWWYQADVSVAVQSQAVWRVLHFAGLVGVVMSAYLTYRMAVMCSGQAIVLAGAGAAPVVPSRRPVVGDKVTVSPGYASCGDAGDGPLRPGELCVW